MFTTLLKVTKTQANKGIYHTRKNGDFVEELFRKDADLVYEVTDKSINYFGQKYAFFIIEAENGDILKYNKQEHHLSDGYFDEYEIYWNSCEVSEMCKQLLKQGKPLPEKLDSLLKDKLSVSFTTIIKRKSKGFDSYSVWENYEWILAHLGKNVNEYISQESIDNFISQLNRHHELRQVERISRSRFIDFSLEDVEGYIKSTEEVEETIAIAKNLISKKGVQDVRYIGDYPRVSIYEENTPCGRIGVHIHLEYGDFNVILAMNNNYIGSNLIIDITNYCQEFAANF